MGRQPSLLVLNVDLPELLRATLIELADRELTIYDTHARLGSPGRRAKTPLPKRSISP